MDYADAMKAVVIGKSSGCDLCSRLEKSVEELNISRFFETIRPNKPYNVGKERLLWAG